MNDLNECVRQYIKEGYNRNYAISKVCQDIIINRIYNSKYSDKITIKGGVVMFHLTNNIRRATVDIDMDLINMSIATENIINIFIELSKLDSIDGFKLSIDKNRIEELSHQDYHGKRLTVSITDSHRKTYNVKLDIGVHKYTDIHQDTLLLNTQIIDGNIEFLVNPKEQIFTEKLIPILKFGPLSTRYRDVFDLYWLITEGNLDKDKILHYMKILIFDSDINIHETQ
ncbi:MAG: nucleotidyl transferase AbiEii/AbiGii toxin family protein [Clostridia bacterium]|nr:nucleotidyl transferase AbiEii/AbiGii toxin family protein [Clostridia bacterium]